MKKTSPTLVVMIAVAVIAAACSGPTESEGEVSGIVTEVTGDLTVIESFVVLDTEGNSHKFIPGDGLTVMGAPPPHLRDHVISGEPVTVVFHEGPDGVLIADDVTHAGNH